MSQLKCELKAKYYAEFQLHTNVWASNSRRIWYAIWMFILFFKDETPRKQNWRPCHLISLMHHTHTPSYKYIWRPQWFDLICSWCIAISRCYLYVAQTSAIVCEDIPTTRNNLENWIVDMYLKTSDQSSYINLDHKKDRLVHCLCNMVISLADKLYCNVCE